MKSFFEKIKERWRRADYNVGYTCDDCGREVFDYPSHRLCEECDSRLEKNDGRVCPKCGRRTKAEGVCWNCKRILPKFHMGFSPFVYRGETAALINKMKNGNPRLCYYFGERIAECFLGRYERKELFSEEKGELTFLIVPIPLSKRKANERGYNQAELLAWTVKEVLQRKGYRATMDTTLLIRRKEVKQQKHLHYKERFENAATSYSVVKRKACKNAIILLVDDILTTGATSGECGRKLLSAGAYEVNFLCAASKEERESNQNIYKNIGEKYETRL